METIELPIDSSRTGGTFNIRIDRNGDLAYSMAFRGRLNELLGRCIGPGVRVAWVRKLGHALMKSVEVKIGGSSIDKQYGLWLELWHELTYVASKERIYRRLIGDVPELTALRGKCSCDPNEVIIQGYDLYVPLQFWFNRNVGLALPLIALQYHEVMVTFELEDISKLIVWQGCEQPYLGSQIFRDAGLMVDYIYLDSEERRRFAQVGHEYLIEQVQHTDESLTGGTCANKFVAKYKLNFNHPTKELIWALQVGAFAGDNCRNLNNSNRGRFLAYTHLDGDFAWERALDDAARNLVRGMLWFVNPSAARGLNPLDYIEVNPCSFGSGHHLCLVPGETQPLRYNLGCDRFLTLNITYDGGEDLVNCEELDLNCLCPMYIIRNNLFTYPGGYDLGNFINHATIDVFVNKDCCDSKNIRVAGVHVHSHNLTLRDVSIPVSYWCDNRWGSEGACHRNIHDVYVIQPNNFGVRLDGEGNPVYDALIQFNGQDRFSVQKGSYFNYLQPDRYHTAGPRDGVNVYSFALKPEEHQPSGSANLSRIDSVYLNITYQDPYRACANVPKLDFFCDSKIHIFAVSYNVLRIISGMGGLAYSN